AEDIQHGSAAQYVQVCQRLAFLLDQARQCQHNRDAGYENEQWKNKIVEGKPFPLHVLQLGPEEVAGRAWCGALVAQHPFERPDRSVGADDPEYAESTQCIDRHDSAGLQCEPHFCITHRAPCSVCGRKRTNEKKVAAKVTFSCGGLMSELAIAEAKGRKAVGELVHACHRGHCCVASADWLLDTEIVPSDKRLVVAVPGCTVVQGLHAGERDGKNRTLHIPLL